jgi:hypothetical protein
METLNIAKITTVRDPFQPGALTYRNAAESKEAYRRVVGGIAWPRDLRPGAVVVLVEHARPMPGQNMHKLEIAAEYTSEDMEQLLRQASLWGDILSCRAWLTPLSAPELRLAMDYNDNRRRLRLPQLEFASPPSLNGSRDFSAYDCLMARRTMGVKTLYFGEASQVAREYKSRQRADLARSLELFPLLAAFLWALASIELDARESSGVGAAVRRGLACVADKLVGY